MVASGFDVRREGDAARDVAGHDKQPLKASPALPLFRSHLRGQFTKLLTEKISLVC